MAKLSREIIAQWAIESLDSEEWMSLSVLCVEGITRQNTIPESEIGDSVERELGNVADFLRNKAAKAKENGEIVIFEIDEEEQPYIRRCCEIYPDILKKLQMMQSDKFEKLCADILKALGWLESESIGGRQDDGVDFHSFGFPNNQIFDLPMPPSCKVLVIGQAKCKQSNTVSETEIRKFVGGALKKLNDFRKSGKVGVLTPVIFAFWTSSDFQEPAKDYARTMGIWFMNGRTLVEYLHKLRLTETI
jgi:restriction endonuclease Mrr